jgi:hypothetical protein
VNTDIVVAAAEAYVSALNKLFNARQEAQPTAGAAVAQAAQAAPVAASYA